MDCVLTSASDMKNVRLKRQKPGLTMPNPSKSFFFRFGRELSGRPRRLMLYGPAHKQPALACTPKTSLSSAQTKL